MNTGVSDTSEPEPARPGVAASIWALEHAQDFVSVAVGVVLIVLAATLAVSGVVSFAEDVQKHSVATAAINLLDRVLLVLILVEIVHTVVLSLRAPPRGAAFYCRRAGRGDQADPVPAQQREHHPHLGAGLAHRHGGGLRGRLPGGQLLREA
jgi:hypothetical protein